MMTTEKIDNFGQQHVKKYSELYVGILAAIIRSAIADYELQRGDISQDMDLLSAIIRATIADYESRRNPQDVEHLTAEIAELRRNLDAANAKVENQDELNSEIQKLRRSLDEAYSSISDSHRQIARMDAGNAAFISELHMQIAHMDADNAALIRSNRELNDALQMMRHQYEMQSTATSAPAPIESAEDDCVDWIIGLKAQRHAWRHVPKAMQLRIIRHALDEMNPAGSTSQSEFNERRPSWMPTATTLCATLHMQWSAINDVNAMLPVGAQ